MDNAMNPDKAWEYMFGGAEAVPLLDLAKPTSNNGAPPQCLESSPYAEELSCKPLEDRSVELIEPSSAAKVHDTGLNALTNKKEVHHPAFSELINQLDNDNTDAIRKWGAFSKDNSTEEVIEEGRLDQPSSNSLQKFESGEQILFNGNTIIAAPNFNKEKLAQIKEQLELKHGKKISVEILSNADLQKLQKAIKNYTLRIEQKRTKKQVLNNSKPNRNTLTKSKKTSPSPKPQKNAIIKENRSSSIQTKNHDKQNEIKKHEEELTELAEQKKLVGIEKQNSRTSINKVQKEKSAAQHEIVIDQEKLQDHTRP